MAGRRFATAVILRRPGTFEATTFLPGDEAPDWAEEVVTNEEVYETADAADSDDSSDGEPPQPSKDWSKAQLATYAAEHDVTVAKSASKADILAAITAAAESDDDPVGDDDPDDDPDGAPADGDDDPED